MTISALSPDRRPSWMTKPLTYLRRRLYLASRCWRRFNWCLWVQVWPSSSCVSSPTVWWRGDMTKASMLHKRAQCIPAALGHPPFWYRLALFCNFTVIYNVIPPPISQGGGYCDSMKLNSWIPYQVYFNRKHCNINYIRDFMRESKWKLLSNVKKSFRFCLTSI